MSEDGLREQTAVKVFISIAALLTNAIGSPNQSCVTSELRWL